MLVGKLSIQLLSRLLVRETFMTAAAETRVGREKKHILFIFQYPTLLLDSSLPPVCAPFVRFSAWKNSQLGKNFHISPSSEMDLCSYTEAGPVLVNVESEETIPNRNRRLRTVIPYSCLSTFRSALGSFLELMPFLSWELFAFPESFSLFVPPLTTVQCFLLSLEIPSPPVGGRYWRDPFVFFFNSPSEDFPALFSRKAIDVIEAFKFWP